MTIPDLHRLRQCRPVSPHRLPSLARPLHCHPAAPCARPLQVQVSLAVAGSETGPGLLLHYTLGGDLSGLRLPPPAEPGPADSLWRHTCFEAFVGLAGEPAYHEFNFSPSGQWAAYRFMAQRQRSPEADIPVRPEIDLDVSDSDLSMQVWLPRSALPEAHAGKTWEIGLSAVIETTDGQLAYWALRHPAAQPDFHHRGGWQPLPELQTLLPPPRPA